MSKQLCPSSNSVKNTSSEPRNPSQRGNRARRTRQLRRSSLNRGMPRASSSIAGLVRRIRSSKWTRWAGRHAPSAIARRQTEARAHSDLRHSVPQPVLPFSGVWRVCPTPLPEQISRKKFHFPRGKSSFGACLTGILGQSSRCRVRDWRSS